MTINNLTKPKWDMYHPQDGNIEHDLYDSLIVEYNDIQGVKCQYYMRNTSISMDRLYGEAVNTAYHDPIETRMTYEVTEEPTITDPFGITSIDVIQYAFIPKSTFSRDVSAGRDPIPGDVVVFPWNQRSYEIADVGEEMSIFQLKKLVWELILKPYRFSDQSQSTRDATYNIDDTLSQPLTAYGDNEWIEDESDDVDNYTDVDESIYGF